MNVCVYSVVWCDDDESDCEHVLLMDDYIKLLKQFAMNCGPTVNWYSFHVCVWLVVILSMY